MPLITGKLYRLEFHTTHGTKHTLWSQAERTLTLLLQPLSDHPQIKSVELIDNAGRTLWHTTGTAVIDGRRDTDSTQQPIS